MEHEKVVKLRSSILDKLYKCDEIYHHTTKFDSIIVIDHNRMDNIITRKSLESVELTKSLTMFENDNDALLYLKSINTQPSLIFINSDFLHILNNYHIDSSKTKIIVLKEKNNNFNKNGLETIEKPLNISILKEYFKI